jgi:hypothetical protein
MMLRQKLRSLIGYVRVSTAQQGRSGLGIEAQKEALERFAAGGAPAPLGYTLSALHPPQR